ncbi:cyclase family protein [Bradyrhizobium sp. Gha]|uniref:cyclase family protein n=1 Tax=Bradyrhizobium sp. Gha TaxID=1855318 RepID=UPI0008ECB3FC|nr:cyclase family protein [Bradyrhizobium sp. Gha]SFK21381.1 Putative cyclase [Bradyrhizobium sp. Gha]
MCPPGCLHNICEKATRRGLLKAGFGVSVAAFSAPLFTGTPAKAGETRSFTDVVDLTHPLYEGFPTFDAFLTYAKDKLNINRWMVIEHTGTHMDGPLHFSADGHSVDMLPIADLVVPLTIIDISQRAQDNPDSAVTPDDVKAWEAKNGPLPDGCCVAMNSGWGKLLEELYCGSRSAALSKICHNTPHAACSEPRKLSTSTLS